MNQWHAGIGDPTFYGWFTVVAYVAAAVACRQVGRASRVDRRAGGLSYLNGRARARMWNGLALFLLLLGINKQLDLQTLFTDIGRELAETDGWYDARAAFQRQFIAAIAGVGAIAVPALLWLNRRAGGWALVALLGSAMLLVFVTIRAASFHHVDGLLKRSWGDFRLNHALELGGIAIVLLGAGGRWRQLAHERRLARLRAIGAAERRRQARRARMPADDPSPNRERAA